MNVEYYLEKIVSHPISESIAYSAALFPNLESLHVISICLVLGTIAIVDLRLLGYSAHRSSAKKLIDELLPYTWAAFAVAVVTGILMFISNATRYFDNPYFQLKFLLIVLAGINMMVFHFTTFRSVVAWDKASPAPLAARISGGVSLSLWIGVDFLGRYLRLTLIDGVCTENLHPFTYS